MAISNNEDQNFRGESNKMVNFVLKQMENTQVLEFLNYDLIKKYNKATTSYYERVIIINLKSENKCQSIKFVLFVNNIEINLHH